MTNIRSWSRWRLSVLALCASLPLSVLGYVSPACGEAPENHFSSDSDSAYIPASAIALIQIRPQAWTGYPDFATPQQRMMPLEVLEAWGKQHLGIHPFAISEIKVVIGFKAMGPQSFGIVVTTLEDFDPANLSTEIVSSKEPITRGGRKLYPLKATGWPGELFLESAGPRTILAGDATMVRSMSAASQGEGPLAELVRNNPPRSADVQILAALKPLREELTQLSSQLPTDLPKPVRELAAATPLLNAARVQAKIHSGLLQLRLEMIGDDENGARELLKIVQKTIISAKGEFWESIAQKLEEMEPGPVKEAWKVYYRRLPDEINAMAPPRLAKDRVTFQSSLSPSLLYPGASIGLLLPAVNASRTASQKANSKNNLQRIALALQLYYEAHRTLPVNASSSRDGKSLLSWRVQLLPFLEESTLYHQFKLDEPWDSPHNLALLPRIPEVFQDPELASESNREKGLTTFHIPVGESFMFSPQEKTEFSAVTDGLSNTVLLLHGNESSLRPWTAPDYLPIETSNPMSFFERDSKGGGKEITVTMGDASIHTWKLDKITPQQFLGILTRDGGEVNALPNGN